jgi:uncharacterized protein YjdB
MRWESSDPAVASVSPAGVVTARAEGAAVVTATSEGTTGRATIAVARVAAASITLTPSSGIARVGGTLALTALVLDSAGGVLDGRPVSWSSSDEGVARVSDAGVVTGVAPGTATIGAEAEGRSASASVVVTPMPVAAVRVTPDAVALHVGGAASLSAAVLDSAGGGLAGRPVAWSSDNPEVATVSATGVVTALAPGSATVAAESEGRAGTALVTVTPVPVASVTVAPAADTLFVGSGLTLVATLRDGTGGVLTGRGCAGRRATPPSPA